MQRRKKYRQSKFNDDEVLLSLLNTSDNEDVIENEDTLEMVYLPLEDDYKQSISNDQDSNDVELLDIREVKKNAWNNNVQLIDGFTPINKNVEENSHSIVVLNSENVKINDMAEENTLVQWT
ncbi:hypothetical protein HHI36_019483 [Cryptolaemus montrouzieri]|uniref:Uncharacterized protein n=1 Tax=Cryptolaemus montrouzieri TaxID=559131 RepID=A0ABD2P3Z8_9CUCU